MPNLLGEYDCGDEPEEEEDSVNNEHSDTSESETESP
jgi:hypothetical protein